MLFFIKKTPPSLERLTRLTRLTHVYSNLQIQSIYYVYQSSV